MPKFQFLLVKFDRYIFYIYIYIYKAKIKKLPINDEVPSGLGHPVIVERSPTVLQLQ